MQDVESLIEFVLRHADGIKQCVEEKRKDAGADRSSDNNSGGTKYKISDPTAMQAIQHVEPIAYIHCPYGPVINGRRDEKYIFAPEKWLLVERNTRQYYTQSDEDNVAKVYKRRYLQGEYGEPWSITCSDLNITRAWYYIVVHDIIRFAELYACGLGLISPYSRFEV